MYFHISLIPRGAYFLLPLESKQEATSGWNVTKCISEVKINQLKVKNIHVKMGISTFKYFHHVLSKICEHGSKIDPFLQFCCFFSTLKRLYVRTYIACSWKTTLIAWIFLRGWYPTANTCSPPPTAPTKKKKKKKKSDAKRPVPLWSTPHDIRQGQNRQVLLTGGTPASPFKNNNRYK